jgi:hypothetical protein
VVRAGSRGGWERVGVVTRTFVADLSGSITLLKRVFRKMEFFHVGLFNVFRSSTCTVFTYEPDRQFFDANEDGLSSSIQKKTGRESWILFNINPLKNCLRVQFYSVL